MTRLVAGLIVGVLLTEYRWRRRIRRALAAEPKPKLNVWLSTMPESGTVTEFDGTTWTWTA